MKQFNFIKAMAFLCVVAVFAIIYQHNQLIKLNYEKQRLEQKKERLKKEHNELLATLSVLQDYESLTEKAYEQWGMKNVQLSHVITLTGHHQLR